MTIITRPFGLLTILLSAIVLTACRAQVIPAQPASSTFIDTTSTSFSATRPSEMTTPTPNPIIRATPCLGLAATPVNTPMPWVYGDYWDKLAVSRIPIKDMVCATREEIVRKLVLQRLEILRTNSQDQECSLEDFTIGEIRSLKNTTQYEFVAWVDYRVKPGPLGYCDWMTTRPQTIEGDGWITTHDVFGVYRENDYFRLIILNAWEV